MMMMMIKECVFVEKKKKKNAHKKSFHTKTITKKMNPFPTTNTTTKKNASFCNPKHIFSTKKRKKNLPKKGLEKEEKEAKEGKRRKRFAKKRHLVAGTSFFPSLSLFFSNTREIPSSGSAKDRHANTREEGKGKKRALSRFIRAFARKGDALFVSSRGRKREREKFQFFALKEVGCL